MSGVGIICGSISGNIECLDIDEKYNVDPIPLLDQLTSLVDAHASGLLSQLVHERSVNGGHHLAYRCSTVSGSMKLARRQPTESEMNAEPKLKSVVLLETRGEGAYFACAPTPGYMLISGTLTDIPEITIEDRNILLMCARLLHCCDEEEKRIDGYGNKKKRSLGRPGDDFNERGDVQPLLEKYGWMLVYTTKDNVQHWRRPGKTEGISATYNMLPGMFYVFSSSCSPLEPQHWYTKFALYAYLEHQGNFEAAAESLVELGYEQTLAAAVEGYLNAQYDFRYNTVLARAEFSEKGTGNFKIVQDYDLNTIQRALNLADIPISADWLARLFESDFSETYDPFQFYYEHLPLWDQKIDYIGQLADTIAMKDPAERATWSEYLKKWIVAAVGCAVNKEVTNHTCLVLVGPQGYYKSTWLNSVVPESLSKYVFVGTIDPANKDMVVHLSECFLINLDELESLSKHELGTLKSVMTLKETRLRRAYDHYAENQIRRASFVASINRSEFLTDETGSRRFLVFEVEQVNLQHGIDMDRVHAQAYALYKSGYKYWFDKDEVQNVNERNKQFSQQTTEDELVSKYCRKVTGIGLDADWMTATEVAQVIQGLTEYKITKASARDFGVALTKAGYEKRKVGGLSRYAVQVKQTSFAGWGSTGHTTTAVPGKTPLFSDPTSGGVKSGVTGGVDEEENGECDLI